MNIEKLTDDQAVKGYDFPIEFKVYSAGAQIKPTSAAITIKDPGGTEQVSDASMTINGTTGTATYTLDDAYTADLWENAVIEIEYVYSSITHKAVFFFDVVLNALKCNVIDDDLKKYFPQIASQIWSGTSNYDGQIQEAFRIVKRLIKDKGRRPAMLIDGSQIRELVIIKAFEIIFFNFAKSAEDIWWGRYEKYKALFEQRFAALAIKYDEDESGSIEDDEEAGLGQVTFQR